MDKKVSREIEDLKKQDLNWTLRDKNYIVWNEKYVSKKWWGKYNKKTLKNCQRKKIQCLEEQM